MKFLQISGHMAQTVGNVKNKKWNDYSLHFSIRSWIIDFGNRELCFNNSCNLITADYGVIISHSTKWSKIYIIPLTVTFDSIAFLRN